MGTKHYRLHFEKLPFMQIFCVGLFLGIIGMHFGKEVFLDNTALLNEQTLYNMKYMEIDCRGFFSYVLRERLGLALGLAVLSTTYLGLFLCGATALWYGVSAGAFLAAAVLRYGLKGIILVIMGVFPHYLIYAPALLSLLVWCETMCRGIYFQKNLYQGKKSIWRLLMILIMMAVGCVLESFANPQILLGFLKIF